MLNFRLFCLTNPVYNARLAETISPFHNSFFVFRLEYPNYCCIIFCRWVCHYFIWFQLLLCMFLIICKVGPDSIVFPSMQYHTPAFPANGYCPSLSTGNKTRRFFKQPPVRFKSGFCCYASTLTTVFNLLCAQSMVSVSNKARHWGTVCGGSNSMGCSWTLKKRSNSTVSE